MGVLIDWMIGWHQTAAHKLEQRAQRHREAEQRWRDRDDDPYECRASFGRSWETAQLAHEWADGYVSWAVKQGAVVVEAPMVFRCYEGHLHVKLNLRWPETVLIRSPYPSLREDDVGTPYPSG